MPDGDLVLDARLGHADTPSPAVADEAVRRAQAGDMEAFAALMARHRVRVLRVAMRLLGNREDAQDAAQEVFIRFYRGLDRVDPSRPLEAWLYRITVNVCKDLGSKRSRHDETRAASKICPPALNPAARNMDAETEARVIEDGLRTLTERERAAVTLRDIEGQSTREVAAIMGVTEMTVRTLISRGRVKLKRYRDQHLGA